MSNSQKDILDINKIISLHHTDITHWEEAGIILTQEGLLRLVEENHRFNYQLWQEEDKARRNDLGYKFVYHAKRAIDHYNQQRNNFIEAIDKQIYEYLKPSTTPTCPIHSETPGMMIDRLSILALKSHYMGLQIERKEASVLHKQSCEEKLSIIIQQKENLKKCLELFIEEILNKSRTFLIYYQFKMYNDPTLNPQLYTCIKS